MVRIPSFNQGITDIVPEDSSFNPRFTDIVPSVVCTQRVDLGIISHLTLPAWRPSLARGERILVLREQGYRHFQHSYGAQTTMPIRGSRSPTHHPRRNTRTLEARRNTLVAAGPLRVQPAHYFCTAASPRGRGRISGRLPRDYGTLGRVHNAGCPGLGRRASRQEHGVVDPPPPALPSSFRMCTQPPRFRGLRFKLTSNWSSILRQGRLQ